MCISTFFHFLNYLQWFQSSLRKILILLAIYLFSPKFNMFHLVPINIHRVFTDLCLQFLYQFSKIPILKMQVLFCLTNTSGLISNLLQFFHSSNGIYLSFMGFCTIIIFSCLIYAILYGMTQKLSRHQ